MEKNAKIAFSAQNHWTFNYVSIYSIASVHLTLKRKLPEKVTAKALRGILKVTGKN